MGRTDHPITGNFITITFVGRGIGQATARALTQRGAASDFYVLTDGWTAVA